MTLPQKISLPLKMFVTFFGAGLSPKAPGTMGTLAALPLAYLLLRAGPLWFMGATLTLTIVAIFASDRYQKLKGGHDLQEIVIDEVVGLLIAITWLPITWQSFLGAFVFFRFFDILKPWPISVLDRKVMGGTGVVIDDVAAGLLANLILQIMFTQTNWLGSQWM